MRRLIGQMETIKIICPACGQQVEAVPRDGRVKGYCAIAKQYVDFVSETQLQRKGYQQDPEYRAKRKTALKNKGSRVNPSQQG